MPTREELRQAWEDAPEDPPRVSQEDVTLSSLANGYVVRPTTNEGEVSASARSIYSTVTENAEPEPAEREAR